jgi:hypothetical protein
MIVEDNTHSTARLFRCDYYQAHSENVLGRHSCSKPEFNNEAACRQSQPAAAWVANEPHGVAAPECLPLLQTRDNHLGDASGGPANYNWTLPWLEDVGQSSGATCVLRIRYNISSAEYEGWDQAEAVDSRYNGARSPVKGNPLSDFVGGGFNVSGPLRLAFDTAQLGRTFEDRSHVFKILPRPAGVGRNAGIYNFNVRGRRGNIVQVLLRRARRGRRRN